MNYDPYAVGERIQSLRKECELTQDQLAIDLNISDRYMRNLERGERVPSIDLFVELRERFGASLDYIVLGITASEREQAMQKQLQETRRALKEMQQHKPLVDAESFRKIGMLLDSRRHTRSRTHDFLLKGLIFCHECGYPLGVINRKTAKGKDELYMVCRTYQRFTKDGVCSCHRVKETTVRNAVIAKVREVCLEYLHPSDLLPIAEKELEQARQKSSLEVEIQTLQKKMDLLTANMDRMYTDRLNGLLPEEDFQRIFTRIKLEREQLEGRRKSLELKKKSPVSQEDEAKELVQRFLETGGENRELLVSLIERIELTADKEIIIKFRFPELDEKAKKK